MLKKHHHLKILLIIATIPILYSCSDKPSPETESKSPKGFLQLDINWVKTSVSGTNASRTAIDCEDSNIKSIYLIVLSENGDKIKQGGPFNCTAGSATLEKIPVGDNRTVLVLAENADKNIIFHGQADNFPIKSNMVTHVEVAIQNFVPKLTAGHDKMSMLPPIISWTNVANASTYELLISTKPDMSDAGAPIIMTENPYEFSDLSIGQTY